MEQNKNYVHKTKHVMPKRFKTVKMTKVFG